MLPLHENGDLMVPARNVNYGCTKGCCSQVDVESSIYILAVCVTSCLSRKGCVCEQVAQLKCVVETLLLTFIYSDSAPLLFSASMLLHISAKVTRVYVCGSCQCVYSVLLLILELDWRFSAVLRSSTAAQTCYSVLLVWEIELKTIQSQTYSLHLTGYLHAIHSDFTRSIITHCKDASQLCRND